MHTAFTNPAREQSPAFKIVDGVKWAYLHRSAGRNILVRANEYQVYKHIETRSATNFHHLYLHSQISGLKSNINPVHSLMSRFTVFKRKLMLDGGEVHFEVRGGDVYITDITIINNYRTKQVNRKAGLYTVKFDSDKWSPDVCNKIGTIHAAVNGLARDINDAADMMPTFINRGYGSKEGLLEQLGEKYTLFHNPYNGFFEADWRCLQDSTGIRGGTHSARRLAAAIKIAAKENRPVNWTVHERGVAIFKEALRLLDKEGTGSLNQQKVFYANSVVNLQLVDKYRRKLGMQLAPNSTLMNDFSLQQAVLTGNLFSESVISFRQIREQGQSASARGRTYGHFLQRGFSRAGIIAGGYWAIPAAGALNIAAWAFGALSMLSYANFATSKANKHVIEGAADNFNAMVGLKRG